MKNKVLLFLLALVVSTGVWAEETTINLGNSTNIKDNATFYLNGVVQASAAWCDKAVYGDVTLTGSISSWTGYIDAKRFSSLTISVPAGLTIKSYSFGIKKMDALSCTANNGSSYTLNNSSPVTISASGLNTRTTTINFTVTGTGSSECRLDLSNFTVNVDDYEFYTITNNYNISKVVNDEYKCASSNPCVFRIQKVSGQSYYTIYNTSSMKHEICQLEGCQLRC